MKPNTKGRPFVAGRVITVIFEPFFTFRVLQEQNRSFAVTGAFFNKIVNYFLEKLEFLPYMTYLSSDTMAQ